MQCRVILRECHQNESARTATSPTMAQCSSASASPPLRSGRLGSGAESDTLETRTKLTSHSALDLGGLPRLPTPTTLQRSWRRPQV